MPRALSIASSRARPLASRRDAEDYIARLRLVNDKFVRVVRHLVAQREAGIIEPALTAPASARTAAANITQRKPATKDSWMARSSAL
mgnify:CR=1 FL=1